MAVSKPVDDFKLFRLVRDAAISDQIFASVMATTAAFFACERGTTPAELLRRGLYNEIAVALRGGEWRRVSMPHGTPLETPHPRVHGTPRDPTPSCSGG